MTRMEMGGGEGKPNTHPRESAALARNPLFRRAGTAPEAFHLAAGCSEKTGLYFGLNFFWPLWDVSPCETPFRQERSFPC